MSRRLVFVGWILLLATPAVAQHRQAPSSRLPAPVFDTSLYNALEWREIGPFRGGRVTAVAGHAAEPLTYYFGGTGGGVWKTTDGGLTWAPISDKDFRAGSIASIWQARRGPWYMSSGGPGSGLFKSTDGGDTWKELTRNEGMPKGTIGKIGVTVSANHDRVWAIVEADSGGVFRSDDGGETWRRTNDERNLRQRAWYYTHIHADPKNPETVYVLNTGMYRSVDGGRSFTQLRAPHGDHHGLWIAPNDPARMINSNDGGANISYNGGATWTGQDNQPTAQFYHVIATTHVPYKVCGSQQDNSTVCIASRTDGGTIGEKDWYEVGGGESGWIAARADDPDIVYAGSYSYLSRLDVRTGQQRNIFPWPDNPMGWGAADLKR